MSDKDQEGAGMTRLGGRLRRTLGVGLIMGVTVAGSVSGAAYAQHGEDGDSSGPPVEVAVVAPVDPAAPAADAPADPAGIPFQGGSGGPVVIDGIKFSNGDRVRDRDHGEGQ